MEILQIVAQVLSARGSALPALVRPRMGGYLLSRSSSAPEATLAMELIVDVVGHGPQRLLLSSRRDRCGQEKQKLDRRVIVVGHFGAAARSCPGVFVQVLKISGISVIWSQQ